MPLVISFYQILSRIFYSSSPLSHPYSAPKIFHIFWDWGDDFMVNTPNQRMKCFTNCSFPFLALTQARLYPGGSLLLVENFLVEIDGFPTAPYTPSSLLHQGYYPSFFIVTCPSDIFTLIPYLNTPCVSVTQLCPTLCDPMDCSPPGSSVHGTLHARILEWVTISSSMWSSQPRNRTPVSHTAGRFFTFWVAMEAQEYWNG